MSIPKLSTEVANNALSRLDKVAGTIMANYESWGMPFEAAKDLVNELDKTADDIEITAFGKESFTARQAEVIKRDADEKYMDTFKNPQAPIQVEADEPYMKAYGPPDQSSAVAHGVSTSGRPLTPHH